MPALAVQSCSISQDVVGQASRRKADSSYTNIQSWHHNYVEGEVFRGSRTLYSKALNVLGLIVFSCAQPCMWHYQWWSEYVNPWETNKYWNMPVYFTIHLGYGNKCALAPSQTLDKRCFTWKASQVLKKTVVFNLWCWKFFKNIMAFDP